MSALIFPETEPVLHDIGKLLFFFNSLSYYLPVESETKNDNGRNLNLFGDLCAGYVPAPLHEDLGRFNALLREMENSRPDDLARLFSAAKAPITTGQIRDKDESSAGTVLSALQDDSKHIADIGRKERLWQARLILKLAEFLARKEIEVSQGMSRIASYEQKVFASLEGQNESESADSEQLLEMGKINSPDTFSHNSSNMLIPIRVKAWAELFLADSSPGRPFTIVTTNPDSASMLLDGYEKTWRKTPRKLFSLSLPPLYADKSGESAINHYISGRKKLHETAEETMKYFENFLCETAENKTQANIQQKYVAAWDEAIKAEFPGSADDCLKLDFYSFPEIPLEILFQKTFKLEPVIDIKNPGYITSMLAILHA
ncbi:hypothetical protein ACFLYW_00400 [Thermodesulfobacteriota bacterium]